MRLNRFIARSGVCSRRKADRLIAEARVTVNGVVCRQPWRDVTPASDDVRVDGERVRKEQTTTVALNKPVGVESTMAPSNGSRRTLPGLLAGTRLPASIAPVGRLDVSTGGLLLLSSDGDLVHRLTHPNWQVPREYVAVVTGNRPVTQRLVRKLQGRPEGSPGRTVELVRTDAGKGSTLRIVLHRGRYHEVRRLLEGAGLRVTSLERVSYGNISVEGLARGELRELAGNELGLLYGSVGLSPPGS